MLTNIFYINFSHNCLLNIWYNNSLSLKSRHQENVFEVDGQNVLYLLLPDHWLAEEPPTLV